MFTNQKVVLIGNGVFSLTKWLSNVRTHFIWSNYSDQKHDTPKGCWGRKNPRKFQGNLRWWNIIPFGQIFWSHYDFFSLGFVAGRWSWNFALLRDEWRWKTFDTWEIWKNVDPLYTMILLKDKFCLLVDDMGSLLVSQLGVGLLFWTFNRLTPPNCFTSGCVYQLSSSVVQEKKTNLTQRRNPFEVYDNNQVTSLWQIIRLSTWIMFA